MMALKGMDVCVKELKLPEDRSGHGAIANFKNEVKLLSEVGRTWRIYFYHYYVDQSHQCLYVLWSLFRAWEMASSN
jgi:hypothetical protein